jgi:hypothetical protein
MDYSEMMAAGRKLLDKHGLHDWRFDVQNLRRRPGLASCDLWGGCIPKVNDLEAALKQSKSEFEVYRYEAHHAFMNEARPEVYDPACAKTAWERTLKFLKKALT